MASPRFKKKRARLRVCGCVCGCEWARACVHGGAGVLLPLLPLCVVFSMQQLRATHFTTTTTTRLGATTTTTRLGAAHSICSYSCITHWVRPRGLSLCPGSQHSVSAIIAEAVEDRFARCAKPVSRSTEEKHSLAVMVHYRAAVWDCFACHPGACGPGASPTPGPQGPARDAPLAPRAHVEGRPWALAQTPEPRRPQP
jgi:hypothetical protein